MRDKELVEEYFKTHGCADIEELVVKLQVPIENLIDIIDELRSEGKLEPVRVEAKERK